ncbi:MAG: gamma-glutamylcyclotransferase [Clostridia bacterium]
MLTKVFVYGTLCQGQKYHHIIKPYAKQIQRATVRGVLYDLPERGYPALVAGEAIVAGELVELQNVTEALRHLDELEDYEENGTNNEYERIVVNAHTQSGEEQECYLYVYPDNRLDWLQQNGIVVPGGDWPAFKG